MSLARYLIMNPTLALLEEGGRHVAHTVPTGTVLTVDNKALDGEKLVNVTWDGKKVMMFAEDLRLRSELVKEAAE